MHVALSPDILLTISRSSTIARCTRTFTVPTSMSSKVSDLFILEFVEAGQNQEFTLLYRQS